MIDLEKDVFHQIDLIEEYVKDGTQIHIVLLVTSELRKKLKKLLIEKDTRSR